MAKLCFIVTSAMTAKTFLPGYLRYLVSAGWEVTLICDEGAGLTELAEREGASFKTVPMSRQPSLLSDAKSLTRVFGTLRAIRPDVVVYATPKASLLGAITSRFLGTPVRVYEQWGLRLETTGGVARRILLWLEKLTARSSSHIVANSFSLARRLEELGVTGPTSVHVLGAGSSHGVDTQRFSPNAATGSIDDGTADFLARTHGMTVGFVGRLHPDKGVDTLADAITSCNLDGPNVRALFIGPDEGASAGYTLARRSPQIHFVGATPDPRPYYAQMDVLVLMSRREGFPNVVLEAAAMAVPAIVADSTGTIDAVDDGTTGSVVPTGDVAALTDALERLIMDPELRRLQGSNARQRAVKDYDQTTVWAQHEAFFRRALLIHQAARPNRRSRPRTRRL
ncbi:glycosyltransferase family 4 protein [Tessaracoccus sp. Y36]